MVLTRRDPRASLHEEESSLTEVNPLVPATSVRRQQNPPVNCVAQRWCDGAWAGRDYF